MATPTKFPLESLSAIQFFQLPIERSQAGANIKASITLLREKVAEQLNLEPDDEKIKELLETLSAAEKLTKNLSVPTNIANSVSKVVDVATALFERIHPSSSNAAVQSPSRPVLTKEERPSPISPMPVDKQTKEQKNQLNLLIQGLLNKIKAWQATPMAQNNPLIDEYTYWEKMQGQSHTPAEMAELMLKVKKMGEGIDAIIALAEAQAKLDAKINILLSCIESYQHTTGDNQQFTKLREYWSARLNAHLPEDEVQKYSQTVLAQTTKVQNELVAFLAQQLQAVEAEFPKAIDPKLLKQAQEGAEEQDLIVFIKAAKEALDPQNLALVADKKARSLLQEVRNEIYVLRKRNQNNDLYQSEMVAVDNALRCIAGLRLDDLKRLIKEQSLVLEQIRGKGVQEKDEKNKKAKAVAVEFLDSLGQGILLKSSPLQKQALMIKTTADMDDLGSSFNVDEFISKAESILELKKLIQIACKEDNVREELAQIHEGMTKEEIAELKQKYSQKSEQVNNTESSGKLEEGMEEVSNEVASNNSEEIEDSNTNNQQTLQPAETIQRITKTLQKLGSKILQINGTLPYLEAAACGEVQGILDKLESDLKERLENVKAIALVLQEKMPSPESSREE